MKTKNKRGTNEERGQKNKQTKLTSDQFILNIVQGAKNPIADVGAKNPIANIKNHQGNRWDKMDSEVIKLLETVVMKLPMMKLFRLKKITFKSQGS